MARFSDRPTADLIVLGLATVVGTTVILLVVAIVFESIFHPERDITVLATRVAAIISSLVAVIVGYLAGRGVQTEGGTRAPQPPPGPDRRSNDRQP